YGLISQKTTAPEGTAALRKAVPSNIFGDDSSDEHDKSAIEDMIKRTSMMKKALDEDTNVFEYDEVYDEMKIKKKAQDTESVTKNKKPRYIEGLLKNAAARKKEDERRVQRKIQTERKKERAEFGDKEAFVTAGYKKKMKEMQREEEAEQKEQFQEEMDVTKQHDLSGFYRHLLKQQCGEKKILEDSLCSTKKLDDRANSTEDSKNIDSDQPVQEDSAKKGSPFKDGTTEIISEQVIRKSKNDNPDADSDFLETSRSSNEDDDGGNGQVATTKIGAKKEIISRTYRKRKPTDHHLKDEQKPIGQKGSDEHDTDER
ncbi:nuclear speckle splicing regulatory protein 1-like, partial [Tropilaelaps mercedesae]